jgi:hypothetical protein
MRLHAHHAGLCALADPQWRRKLWSVGLWLFVPVLGWPAALGYRTRFVRHLFGSPSSALPETRGSFFGCAIDGLRAIAVIFGYLAPLYAAVFGLVASRGWQPGAWTLGMTACFVAYPIFSTLSLPIACVLFAALEPYWLTPGEAALCLAAYAVLIFLVPAGFLDVTRTGRYRSAFALWRSLPFLAKNFAGYVEAWITSGMMGLLGHTVVPVAPWGVAWCYLGIIVCFNELLLGSASAPPNCAGFERLLSDERFARRGNFGRAQVVDACGEPAAILDLVRFSLPLPRWPR